MKAYRPLSPRAPIAIALACALPLTGCISTPVPLAASAATAQAFDPFVFFLGRSRGEGRLQKLFSDPVTVQVRSSGRMEGADMLILDQSVTEGDKPKRQRQWRLSRTAPGLYEGTLSDATDTVRADIREDGTLRIRYTMKDGFTVRQILTLNPGGQSADNRMTIRKFGLIVARLDERIERE